MNEYKKAERAYSEELSIIINSDSHTFHKTIRELTNPQRSTTFRIRTEEGIHVTVNNLNECFSEICRSNPRA